MTINITDKELSALVKNHVSQLVSIDIDRLKVSFTKRGTQIDTSVEILAPGEPKSIIDIAVKQDTHAESEWVYNENVQETESTQDDNVTPLIIK